MKIRFKDAAPEAKPLTFADLEPGDVFVWASRYPEGYKAWVASKDDDGGYAYLATGHRYVVVHSTWNEAVIRIDGEFVAERPGAGS